MDSRFLEHLRGRAAEERRYSKHAGDPSKAALHLELAQRYEAVLSFYEAVYPEGRPSQPV